LRNRYPVRGTNSVPCMYGVKSPLSVIRSNLFFFPETGSSIVTRLSYKNLSFHDSNCWGVILAECHIEYVRSIRIMNSESWFSLHLPLRQVFCSCRLYYGRPTLMEKGRFPRSQNNLRGQDCSVILQVWCRLRATLGCTARGRVLQSTTNWIVIWPYKKDRWIVGIMLPRLRTLCRLSHFGLMCHPPQNAGTRWCKARLLPCYR